MQTSGAETIFGQGGQDRERQNREREIKVFAGTGAFFCPENKRSPKKKVFAGLGAFFKRSLRRIWAFFVPKMVQDTSLRGAKVAQEGQNISRGGSCPPWLPTFRAYGANCRTFFGKGKGQGPRRGGSRGARSPPPMDFHTWYGCSI